MAKKQAQTLTGQQQSDDDEYPEPDPDVPPGRHAPPLRWDIVAEDRNRRSLARHRGPRSLSDLMQLDGWDASPPAKRSAALKRELSAARVALADAERNAEAFGRVRALIASDAAQLGLDATEMYARQSSLFAHENLARRRLTVARVRVARVQEHVVAIRDRDLASNGGNTKAESSIIDGRLAEVFSEMPDATDVEIAAMIIEHGRAPERVRRWRADGRDPLEPATAWVRKRRQRFLAASRKDK